MEQIGTILSKERKEISFSSPTSHIWKFSLSVAAIIASSGFATLPEKPNGLEAWKEEVKGKSVPAMLYDAETKRVIFANDALFERWKGKIPSKEFVYLFSIREKDLARFDKISDTEDPKYKIAEKTGETTSPKE